MPLARSALYTFLASLFGTVFVWGFWPWAWTQGWPLQILLGLATISFVLWLIFSLDRLRLWMKKRSTQYALGLLLATIGSIAILVFVNYVAAIYNVKKDITQNRIHTLSDQTQKIAGELKENIVLRVWSTGVERMSANIDMRKFLENYQIASHGKIKIEIKNPNQDNLEAKRDGIKRDNVLIVRSASGREIRIENFNDTKGEEQVTNAIVQAIKGRKKTICFLAGHGELGLEDAQAEGLSSVKSRLADSAYEAKEIMLATQEKMPAECEVVVSAGPRGDAVERELTLLKDYLGKGGKFIALFGPGVPNSWRSLTMAYGVEVRSDLVIDTRVQPPIAVATNTFASDVEIVRAFNRMVIFPEVSSIHVPTASKDGGVNIKTFVSSGPHTYAKAGNPKTIRTLQKMGGDLSGPFPVAVLITKPVELTPVSPKVAPKKASPSPAAPAPTLPPVRQGSFWRHVIHEAYAQENSAPPPGISLGDLQGGVVGEDKKAPNETSIVLFSNHTFVANSIVTQMGNMDLFLNSINFLMRDNDLIGIRPRELRQASLELSGERLRMVYATVFLIAGLFLVMGIRAGRRRSAT